MESIEYISRPRSSRRRSDNPNSKISKSRILFEEANRGIKLGYNSTILSARDSPEQSEEKKVKVDFIGSNEI